MKKRDVMKHPRGSAEFVLAHALWRRQRGRHRPSSALHGSNVKDPRRAVCVARWFLGLEERPKRPPKTIIVGDHSHATAAGEFGRKVYGQGRFRVIAAADPKEVRRSLGKKAAMIFRPAKKKEPAKTAMAVSAVQRTPSAMETEATIGLPKKMDLAPAERTAQAKTINIVSDRPLSPEDKRLVEAIAHAPQVNVSIVDIPMTVLIGYEKHREAAKEFADAAFKGPHVIKVLKAPRRFLHSCSRPEFYCYFNPNAAKNGAKKKKDGKRPDPERQHAAVSAPA